MKFSDIVEASIEHESRQIKKALSKRTVELYNKINKYNKSINKMKSERARLKRQLSSAKSKKAAKLIGQIAGLDSAISDLEDKKNNVTQTLEKYKEHINPVPKPETSAEEPEPEENNIISTAKLRRKYHPMTARKSSPATKGDLERFLNKMQKEITANLKSYIDSKVKEEPGEVKKEVEKKIEKEVKKAKEEAPKQLPATTSKPVKKTQAYKEVQKELLTGLEAPFKAGPLKPEVENALNKAFKENPEADYDELIDKINELVPEFTIQ